MTKLHSCIGMLAALLAFGAGAARAQHLFWLDTDYDRPVLWRSNFAGSDIDSFPLAKGTLPEGLAYSAVEGKLWIGEATHWSAALRWTTSAGSPTNAAVTGERCVRGVAVHSGDGRLFWTTSYLVTGSQVHRADAGGANPQVLLNLGGTSNLRGLAVDAAAGRLYFADFDQGLILRSNLDGSGLATFQNTGAGTGPYGLLIDPATQRLYWTEYGAGRVRWASLAGGAPTTLYAGLVNPTYLTFIPSSEGGTGAGYLLWSEAAAGAQRIVLAQIDGTGVYPTSLPLASYGGLVWVPGNPLDAGGPPPIVHELSLAPVWPNPATAASVVEFSLPSEMAARLTLCDVQGRRVAQLHDGVAGAGPHRVPLAATWAAHRPAPGVYFLRLEAGPRTLTRKLVVAD